VAAVKSTAAYGGGTGNLYYYQLDHLDTPRYAYDQLGNLAWGTDEQSDPYRVEAWGGGVVVPRLGPIRDFVCEAYHER